MASTHLSTPDAGVPRTLKVAAGPLPQEPPPELLRQGGAQGHGPEAVPVRRRVLLGAGTAAPRQIKTGRFYLWTCNNPPHNKTNLKKKYRKTRRLCQLKSQYRHKLVIKICLSCLGSPSFTSFFEFKLHPTKPFANHGD